MIHFVREEVAKLLANQHRQDEMSHIDRVVDLSVKMAESVGMEDLKEIKLIALLHDMDGYDLYQKAAGGFTCARDILGSFGVSSYLEDKVLAAVHEIGFLKRLQGIRPQTTEAKLVSDADMCDAMGINGIIRAIQRGESEGVPFFDKDNFPRKDFTYSQYMENPPKTTVGRIFEDMLTMGGMILTAPGRLEAYRRTRRTVSFLQSYFKENGLKDWDRYLAEYRNGGCMQMKKTVSLIAARSRNNVIGIGGKIPWKIKGEQKQFKELTMGNAVIMGRRTYEDMGRPLPGRTNIVVSGTKKPENGILVAKSLKEALGMTAEGMEAFVIGGRRMYEEALASGIVSTMYLTEVDLGIEDDGTAVYFPEFDRDGFEIRTYPAQAGESPGGPVSYARTVYQRKKFIKEKREDKRL